MSEDGWCKFCHGGAEESGQTVCEKCKKEKLCGAETAAVKGVVKKRRCDLPKGHEGWHEQKGSSWNYDARERR